MSSSEVTGADGDRSALSDIEHELIHHTSLPHTTISRFLDGGLSAIGVAFSFLWIATVGVILYSVISRYVFSQGSVMLEEVQWHLAGAAWLVGLSYTLVHDDHVRVDVLPRTVLPTHASGGSNFSALFCCCFRFWQYPWQRLFPMPGVRFCKMKDRKHPMGCLPAG